MTLRRDRAVVAVLVVAITSAAQCELQRVLTRRRRGNAMPGLWNGGFGWPSQGEDRPGRRCAQAALTLVLLIAVLPVPSARAQCPPGADACDGEFNASDWQVSSSSLHGAAIVTRKTSGGNPGAYREISIHVDNTQSGHPLNFSLTKHIFTGFTWNPATLGAIRCVDLGTDSRDSAGLLTRDRRLNVLRQGGKDFVAEVGPISTTAWSGPNSGCWDAASFFADDGSTPDFSSSGTEIQFGFGVTAFGQFLGPVDSIVGIDNWHVKITRSEPPHEGVDLRITKSDGGQVEWFNPIAYSIGFANRGTRTATGVRLTETIPAHTRGDCPVPNGGQSCPWSCTPDRREGSKCTLEIGTLGPGAVGEQVFRVIYTSGAYDSIFNEASISDDGTHGPDLNPFDNADADTTPPVEPCDASAEFAFCCALTYLCHQVNPLACFGSTPLTPAPSRRLTAAATLISSVTGDLFDTAQDLWLFYKVRDRVFRKIPGGRRATELYYEHDPEIKSLLIASSDLRTQALAVLGAWKANLQKLVDGQGASATVTPLQVAAITQFLDALDAAASPALRGVIATQRQAIGLDSFAGLTLDQALARLNRFTCAESDTTLCLEGGRFRVETTWATPDGKSGSGHASRLTQDSGTFWFFDQSNIETIVKVLDACSAGGHFWTFGAGLTSVKVTTTVTDTKTGAVRTYINPQGRPFKPIQDTSAFNGCGASASGGARARSAAANPRPIIPPATSGEVASCAPSGTVLCLGGGRFRVEASWRTSLGETGAGQAIALTPDSGYFWFFGPDNVEVLVKALNGCGVNERFWIFSAGLTNVEVTLHVIDIQTGASQTYTNPLGTAFAPILDTSAFSACP